MYVGADGVRFVRIGDREAGDGDRRALGNEALLSRLVEESGVIVVAVE